MKTVDAKNHPNNAIMSARTGFVSGINFFFNLEFFLEIFRSLTSHNLKTPSKNKHNCQTKTDNLMNSRDNHTNYLG
jgi:hypothetical protein